MLQEVSCGAPLVLAVLVLGAVMGIPVRRSNIGFLEYWCVHRRDHRLAGGYPLARRYKGDQQENGAWICDPAESPYRLCRHGGHHPAVQYPTLRICLESSSSR